MSDDNRLYCGDCKAVLANLIKEGKQVDLIYLDPPFNSNRTYNLTYKSEGSRKTAQQAAFDDTWTPTGQTQAMAEDFRMLLEEQRDIDPSFKVFLSAWLSAMDGGDSAMRKLCHYLMYMAERLILMKRVLKDTGSIYFHCDPTASHYIKVVMGGIFGRDKFQNEIVWCYPPGGGGPKYGFHRKHDIILYYSRNNEPFFVRQYTDMSEATKLTYRKIEETGRKYKEYAGRKSYLDEIPGRPVPSWWTDITSLGVAVSSKERRGYPTQKPIALLDRIIKASCPPGGTVLDPFCGCGTAVDSAILNGKNWIGIDISNFSIDIIKDRIKERGIEEERDFTVEFLRPKTWEEYNRLDPYEKQDFLIQKMGGIPNRRKSGDGGVDGELTIHKGIDKNGEDIWGKVIFSVKTGNQGGRAALDELSGAVSRRKADIGVLLLDRDPSPNVLAMAEGSKKLKYRISADLKPAEFDTLQIYTAQQILEDVALQAPHSMLQVKAYRKMQRELFA